MSAIEITTKIGCVNACSYCPQDKLMAAYREKSSIFYMEFDLFKKCINNIPVNINIHFSGMCEPWLNPRCTDMLLYAHQKGHKILVYTTLIGMNLSDIEIFEPIPFLDFYVHLPFEEIGREKEASGDYLKLLKKISRSRIKNLTFRIHRKEVLREIKPLLNNKNIIYLPLSTRGGNVEFEGVNNPKRRQKIIGCLRNLRQNVLLPNGDVIICCMDYGMKHILGNLLVSDYSVLFDSEEFLRVKRGLKCGSADILCKHCDGFSYEAIFFDKVWRYFFAGLKNPGNFRFFPRLLWEYLKFK